MLFPEAPFIPAAKCALSDLEGKARSFAGSQIRDLCQGPNQAFYRQWSCQHFLPQSVLSSSDVHCGKPLGKYDGNEREARETEDITRKTQLWDVCRESFLSMQRISQTLFFLGLTRANPLGQNAARISISLSWSAASGLWERRGGRRLECRPDTISWAHWQGYCCCKSPS